jgi:hypothetical protein
MAYCSYCAAVLDPSQATCARCGRPAATAPAPVTAVVSARPGSVRLAGVLILISLAISILTLATTLLLHGGIMGTLFWRLIPTVGLWVVWIVLVLLLWQRQSWVRIAILLLIAWNIGNLLITILRVGGSFTASWSFGAAIAMDGMRLYAAYLTFRPESTAWFRYSPARATET